MTGRRNYFLADIRGDIESPGFPKLYPDNYNATYIIFSIHTFIHLQFQSFNLESSYRGMCFDAVSVISDKTDILCGAFQTEELETLYFVSVTGKLAVTFSTDNKIGHSGFRFIYFTVDKHECNKTLTLTNDNITSIAYPKLYFPWMYCVISIRLPSEFRIQLTIKDMDIPMKTNGECLNDSLQIISGNSTDTLCGNSSEYSSEQLFYQSSLSEVDIIFTSDYLHEGRGFWIEYSSHVPCSNKTFVNTSGNVYSDNYPNKYSNNQDCFYIIQLSETNGLLELVFESFYTEAVNDAFLRGDLCNLDYLEIHIDDKVERICEYSFEIVRNPLTWEESQNDCQHKGGFLVAITDIDTQLMLEKYLIQSQNCTLELDAFWIGANDALTENHFQWVNGHPVEFEYWFPGWHGNGHLNKQPSDDGFSEEDCVEIRRTFHNLNKGTSVAEHFFWNDRKCTTRNPYICQISKFDDNQSTVLPPTVQSYMFYLNSSQPDVMIESPGFPEHYPMLSDINYTIIVPTGYNVAVRFNHFNIESSDSCIYDNLTLASVVRTEEHKTTCGDWNTKLKKMTWVSETNIAVLRFRSDKSIYRSGFSLTASIYKCDTCEVMQLIPARGKGQPIISVQSVQCEIKASFVCVLYIPETKIQETTVNCTSYTGEISMIKDDSIHYDNNRIRQFQFQAPKYHRIVLEITFLDLEFQSDCLYDALIFRGFKNDYSPTPTIVAAKQLQPNSSGEIVSPHYPDFPPLKIVQITSLAAPIGYRIDLNMSTYVSKVNGNCRNCSFYEKPLISTQSKRTLMDEPIWIGMITVLILLILFGLLLLTRRRCSRYFKCCEDTDEILKKQAENAIPAHKNYTPSTQGTPTGTSTSALKFKFEEEDSSNFLKVESQNDMEPFHTPPIDVENFGAAVRLFDAYNSKSEKRCAEKQLSILGYENQQSSGIVDGTLQFLQLDTEVLSSDNETYSKFMPFSNPELRKSLSSLPVSQKERTSTFVKSNSVQADFSSVTHCYPHIVIVNDTSYENLDDAENDDIPKLTRERKKSIQRQKTLDDLDAQRKREVFASKSKTSSTMLDIPPFESHLAQRRIKCNHELARRSPSITPTSFESDPSYRYNRRYRIKSGADSSEDEIDRFMNRSFCSQPDRLQETVNECKCCGIERVRPKRPKYLRMSRKKSQQHIHSVTSDRSSSCEKRRHRRHPRVSSLNDVGYHKRDHVSRHALSIPYENSESAKRVSLHIMEENQIDNDEYRKMPVRKSRSNDLNLNKTPSANQVSDDGSPFRKRSHSFHSETSDTKKTHNPDDLLNNDQKSGPSFYLGNENQEQEKSKTLEHSTTDLAVVSTSSALSVTDTDTGFSSSSPWRETTDENVAEKLRIHSLKDSAYQTKQSSVERHPYEGPKNSYENPEDMKINE
ncbi:uncharacterized protein LOC127702837 [Mytilus californianus]|uniref:uncharacterized protein LOC127702837 n=1 Tax=Mytilus californianus TaxID=6549 RepID=UPI00224658CA|nr:uncharacterized protein LOC127702837 [Mytilus californianus]